MQLAVNFEVLSYGMQLAVNFGVLSYGINCSSYSTNVRQCFDSFNHRYEDLCMRNLGVFSNHLRSKKSVLYAYNN
jgi:hypothetical protein